MSAPKRKAFTLIEVMIAIGIIALSITSLVGLLSAISTKIADVNAQSKAISLSSDLQIMLKTKSFDEIYSWVKNPGMAHAVYFWEEFSNESEVSDPSLTTVNSELPGMKKGSPPEDDSLDKVKGNIYRVLLSVSSPDLIGRHVNLDSPEYEYAGGSLPENADKYGEAFLPIKAEFIMDPRDDIILGSGTEDQNRQRRIYVDRVIKMR